MKFELIDIINWKRREYFNHYLNNVPCTYSMTLNLDITNLLKVIKGINIKLYPSMIHLLSRAVNSNKEFRTGFNEKNELGVFSVMNPSYTIFNKESELFSSIWTEYQPSLSKFNSDYLIDIEKYSNIDQLDAKPNTPPNTFYISSIPWVAFTGFNLNIPKASNYLLPIFTTGKYFEQNDKIHMPISIQVHHAVCDGFHVARFVNDLQELINTFENDSINLTEKR